MTGPPSRPPAANESLARRHYLALGLVGGVILLNQALVQPPLWRLATDAPVINLAGRQRMLSQQLAKTALELDLARRSRDRGRDALAGDLRSVADRWATVHRALRGGPADSGTDTPALRAAWDRIDPVCRAIHDASGRLARPDRPAAAAAADLAEVLRAEPDYLDQMDRIVGLLEAEARGRVAGLRRLGWALAGSAWVGLAAIGWFLLRPTDRMIQRQFGMIQDARRDAEAAVDDRTRALERANADLRLEAAQRVEAQAQHRAVVDQFGLVARANTLGEMATSLAHEINQPLAAAANYLEGSLVALGDPEPPLAEVRAALARALAATHRAGQVLHRIRHFVRRQPVLVERFDANQVVAEVEALLRDEIRRDEIGLELRLAPCLPRVVGDPVQVQQVLVNLVRNAVDALRAGRPERPTLVLATGRAAGSAVDFAVTDNGEGIPPAKLPHVFDPFFSTRAEGMGMGLAISRTIIEAHQGRLSVQSEPGLATTFRFSLLIAGDSDDDPADGLRRG